MATQEIASFLLLLDYVFGGLLVILTRLPCVFLILGLDFHSSTYLWTTSLLCEINSILQHVLNSTELRFEMRMLL